MGSVFSWATSGLAHLDSGDINDLADSQCPMAGCRATPPVAMVFDPADAGGGASTGPA